MNSIGMVSQGPLGSPVMYLAMNQGRASVQIKQLSPAVRMPEYMSNRVLYGQKMTGMGAILDLDS